MQFSNTTAATRITEVLSHRHWVSRSTKAKFIVKVNFTTSYRNSWFPFSLETSSLMLIIFGELIFVIYLHIIAPSSIFIFQTNKEIKVHI